MVSQTDRHSPHLNALRIVASAAIVLMHYANYAKDYRFGQLAVDHLWHFNLFVDLFFVVSGFVITDQYLGRVGDCRSILHFLGRRFARIYPLHIATFAFYLAIAIAFHIGFVRVENPERYPWSDIPAQLLLLHAVNGARLTYNYPSWSLSAEMVCYCSFPLIALVALRRPAAVIVLAISLAATLTFYVVLSGAAPWPQWINQGGAVRALPGFCLGVALYLYRGQIGRLRFPPVTLSAALAIFMLAGWALADTTALIAVYVIAAIAVYCDQSNARTLLTRLGLQHWAHLTYSSYMLHIPVATIVITMVGRFAASLFPGADLMLIVMAALVLVPASVACYRYFENPLRHSLSAAFDRHLFARQSIAVLAAPQDGGR